MNNILMYSAVNGLFKPSTSIICMQGQDSTSHLEWLQQNSK